MRWWLLALLMAASVSCRRAPPKPGKSHTCSCPYLTDYDDQAKHKVVVCVPEGVTPEAAANDCVLRHQSGHLDPCVCADSSGTCDGTETCRSLENQ